MSSCSPSLRLDTGGSWRSRDEPAGAEQPPWDLREAVAKLERAELGGGITIAKLFEVAGALDCTLVYALVPNTSLEDTVQRQARRVAAERLGYVATTMALEDQDISAERRDEHLESYARDLVAHNDLWRVR